MFRFIAITSLFIVFSFKLSAQNPQTGQPKLVVAVVVDQMRYDYITRYYERYSNNGFKRLINEGFFARNHHFDYLPTYTAPGHASIFTGSAPEVHGIISNNWYDKFTDATVYCVNDDTYSGVGTAENSGKMSPRRLLSNTLADQLKLHTNGRSKSIGISIKDRGAILPAGHAADAAYWLPDDSQGKFVSSTYYFESLPNWVTNFNNSKQKETYLTTWNTLYPIKTYVQSDVDNSPYEGVFEGKESPTFPYDLKALAQKNKGFGIVKYTPFGNSYLTDFALEAIQQEQLGKRGITDFISISYSSPDYIGHKFGANAIETEDTYLRLDLEIERLLNFLDKNLGKNNYTFVLTADHGAVHVPAYLQDLKIPGGYIDAKALRESIENYVDKAFGDKNLIKNISNYQVFFNYQLAQDKNITLAELETQTAHFIQQLEWVDKVFTRAQFKNGLMPEGVGRLLQKGFNPQRSGDVIFSLKSGYISYSKTGTTHGSGFNYDTQVPLLLFGHGVKNGHTFQKTRITDIAPTLAAILGITSPAGATGRVLYEAIK